MRPNHTKRKLAEGKVVFGAFCSMLDPAVVEIIGEAGYDFCVIDMEHVPVDLQLVEHLVRAADAVDVTPIVRVADDSARSLLRVLETGVQGIMVPHVMSGAHAAQLVRAIRYPPAGARGISGTSRAARYGLMDPDRHLRESDSELLLIGMLEDRQAVGDIEAILSTPGLDVAFVAPYDLAGSLGDPFTPMHPVLNEAVEKILATSSRVGGAKIGFPSHHRMCPMAVPDLIQLGVPFIVTAVDYPLLAQAFKRDVESLAPYRQ